MDFKGQYLSFEEYRGLGGTLDLTPFNLLEFEARRQIDIRTQLRLKNSKEIPQEVKLCEYKLINSIYEYINTSKNITENSNIKSENTDGYSISYSSIHEINDVIKSKNSEIEDIINAYLLSVVVNGEHLMYCGIR